MCKIEVSMNENLFAIHLDSKPKNEFDNKKEQKPE